MIYRLLLNTVGLLMFAYGARGVVIELTGNASAGTWMVVACCGLSLLIDRADLRERRT
jgi:hypothetical protein